MRKELRHERSDGKRGGRKRAEEEGSNGGGREQRSEGEEQVEHGRKGDREGGKLQGRHPEEDTGQCTVCRAQNNTQRGPCHCDFDITNRKLQTGI